MVLKTKQSRKSALALRRSDQAINRLFLSAMVASLLVAFAFMLSTTTGLAQSSETPAVVNPVEGTVPGESKGFDSDSDLWRALKSGTPGTIVGQDSNSAVAIQVNGQDWRLARNGPVTLYMAWGLLGTLGLLCLFFALRGRIRIGHGGPSGETISRFTLFERLGHWLLASSFIILAITGINLVFGRPVLIPLIGKEAFATITNYGKFIHNYVAFSFMVSLVWVTITWIAHNIPHPRDLVWFAKGGGILGGAHPAAKKFNAGQKIIFWLVVLGGFSLSLSGWALLFPFTTHHFSDTFAIVNSVLGTELPTTLTLLQEQQLAQIWHGLMSIFMICVIIAHIYIGSVGMEGALDAMTTGDVDLNWAREHHSLWVEEEEAKAKAKGTSSGTMQPAE